MNDYNNSKIPFLFEILERKGISGSQLAAGIGVSTGNIFDWKSGRSTPKLEAICKIADYLDCSTDYLLGRTSEKSFSSAEISADEKKLLSYYNSLNDEGKEKALERLEEMTALDRYKKRDELDVVPKEA